MSQPTQNWRQKTEITTKPVRCRNIQQQWRRLVPLPPDCVLRLLNCSSASRFCSTSLAQDSLSLLIPSLVLSSKAGASCGPFAFPFGFDTGQLLHQISILCLKKKIIFLALRYSQQNIILNTALKYKQYLGQVKKSRGFYNLSPNMASIISFYPATHLQNYPILSLSRNNSRSKH